MFGPSGVGKTLAARHAAAEYGASVWIDVQAFTTVEEVVAECLQDLDADQAPGDSDVLTLKRALDESERLLVIDGIHQEGLDGLAQLLESIMATTSTARILCTAITSAGMPAELPVAVPPLPVPAPHEPLDGPAVELFVSRFAGAGGGIPELKVHEPRVRSLVEASGGLPLLLEQFAAQAAVAGLADVVTVDSLEEVVAGSYAMLDGEAQRACRRLATMEVPIGMDVFAEVIGASRMEAVATAALLHRQSLVSIGTDGLLSMLAPIRRHVLSIARETDDPAAALAGIVRWADRVLPVSEDGGAGDAPWLGELDTLTRAVTVACSDPATLDLGYRLANRAWGSLYTAMRPREALELLEIPLAAGEGPPDVGAQAARRAGIAASEVRGTFEGLPFLERSEAHAVRCDDPALQLARIASIRAEMYLDAGQLDAAFAEAGRVPALSDDTYAVRQSRRTCMDVEVSRGHFDAAERLAPAIIDGAPEDERWLGIAARVLLGQIAWEQGRGLEAAAMARTARDDAVAVAEDRIALLADVLHRRITGERAAIVPDVEQLPWAVRLTYQIQEAREVLAAGDIDRAAGLAADVVVLGDSSRLERDGIEARIVLGDALLAQGDSAQAMSTYAVAVRRAAACPLPLRAADALDGIAVAVAPGRPDLAARCAGAAQALRSGPAAVRSPRPALDARGIPAPKAAGDWIADGALTPAGLQAITHIEAGSPAESGVATMLTRGQLAVAELVGEGMTSKQIAERLYLSPRTVDNHLAQIYRRLDIPSRARLAVLMADVT